MVFEKYYQKLRGVCGLGLQLAKVDFKLKNEGSFVGIFWYLLNPVIMFFSMYAIFSGRLGNKIAYYPVYLILGIVMFNFFRNVTTESSNVIRNNGGIIKSINFPKESLVFGIILKNLFSHVFEILLIITVMIISGISVLNILYYFIVLIFFIIFIFGFSLILSSLSVYFIDISNVWNYGVGILLLATPVFYAIDGQTRLLYLNLFNPVYYFITITRELIIYGKMPDAWLILGVIGYSVAFLLIGLFIFDRFKYKFSELI